MSRGWKSVVAGLVLTAVSYTCVAVLFCRRPDLMPGSYVLNAYEGQIDFDRERPIVLVKRWSFLPGPAEVTKPWPNFTDAFEYPELRPTPREGEEFVPLRSPR